MYTKPADMFRSTLLFAESAKMEDIRPVQSCHVVDREATADVKVQ